MSQTKAQLVTNVASGFNVTGVVTATKFDGALATNATGTNLTLSGDLTVQGSQTIINSDTLDVKDKTVGIASTSTPTSATQDGAGIEIYGPSNVTIKYDDQKGGIGINTGLTVTGILTATGDIIAHADSMGSVKLVDDGNIEITNNNGGIIDFKTSESEDFDCRIRQMSNGFQFMTGGNGSADERLRITNAGEVGINSTVPETTLDVVTSSASRTWTPGNSVVSMFERNGISRIAIVGNSAGSSQIDFGDTNDDNAGYIKYLHTDDSMAFRTNGNEALVIDSEGGFKFSNAALTEKVKIISGKLSDNQNINLDNGMVHYFTTTETTTSTPNITASAGINTIMSTGDTMVVTIITTAAAGAYSAQLTIEGVGVTENWIGGEAPAAGGASGVDIYSYTIIKTGAGTTDFTVIGNLSKTSA